MNGLTSRKASRVSRTSPLLSSTTRTSSGMRCSSDGVHCRHLFPKTLPVLGRDCRGQGFMRQLGNGQPEVIDRLDQTFELFQLYRLAEVAVGMEPIAAHNILVRRRSSQDHGGDGLEAVIVLDASQNLTAIHSGHVQ